MTRILAVCLGNICRSPMAEAVIRDHSARRGMMVTVDGAGTSDWHSGNPANPPAVRAAAARGYDLSTMRARQTTPDDFERYDLILAMDTQNRMDLEELRPAGNTTPVELFLDYAKVAQVKDVPDPYYTGDFEGALDLIEDATEGLLDQLQKASAV